MWLKIPQNNCVNLSVIAEHVNQENKVLYVHTCIFTTIDTSVLKSHSSVMSIVPNNHNADNLWKKYLIEHRHQLQKEACIWNTNGRDTCVCVCELLSRVRLFATPWTVAHQAPLSVGFSRQEYWSGLPFPSPKRLTKVCKIKKLHLSSC